VQRRCRTMGCSAWRRDNFDNLTAASCTYGEVIKETVRLFTRVHGGRTRHYPQVEKREIQSGYEDKLYHREKCVT